VTVAEPVNEDKTPQVSTQTPAPDNYVAAEQTENNAPVEIAQATPPQETEPIRAADNDIPQAPRELPKTASELVEIGLLGLVFVGGAITARKARLS